VDIKYVGMDVRKESDFDRGDDGNGKLAMESIIEPKASTILQNSNCFGSCDEPNYNK
jgi:hypothetical protein